MQFDEMLQVESEYTSAAIKTALALETWWKQSTANFKRLSLFAHILIVRLNACFPYKHSTSQRRECEELTIDLEQVTHLLVIGGLSSLILFSLRHFPHFINLSHITFSNN